MMLNDVLSNVNPLPMWCYAVEGGVNGSSM